MESLILLENLIQDTQSKNEIMLKLIEEEVLGNFVEKISKSNRIFVYGRGVSSSIVGQELKRAFTELGKYVFDLV
ncbi:SIS domain-containing protein, partial [Clostridium perfringens]